MAALKLNMNPSDSQLRQFGLIALVAFPLLGWIFTSETKLFGSLFGDAAFVWDWGHPTAMKILAGIGLVCGILAVAYPQGLKYLFLALSLLTFPIGLVISELVMLLTFYGMFAPIGLLFRMIGRDHLERRIDKAAPSYWSPKPQPSSVSKYYRQS